MSPELDLQDMIFKRLTSDAAVTWSVFDRAPTNQSYPFISFGTQTVLEDDDEGITGTAHTFQVDLWSSEDGTAELNEMIGIVKQSLHNFAGELTDNALHSIRFVSSRVIQEPDGVSYHGVVQFEALIETP